MIWGSPGAVSSGMAAMIGSQAATVSGSSAYGIMSVANNSGRPSLSTSPTSRLMVLWLVVSKLVAVHPSSMRNQASSGTAKSFPTMMSCRPSLSISNKAMAIAWADLARIWGTNRLSWCL